MINCTVQSRPTRDQWWAGLMKAGVSNIWPITTPTHPTQPPSSSISTAHTSTLPLISGEPSGRETKVVYIDILISRPRLA